MSEKERVESEPTYGEGDVAEILERAIKLDGVRETRVTVEQLREAALEVGVSPAAFAQAVADFGRGHTPPTEASLGKEPTAPFRSAIRTGLTVAFGGILGATAGIMDGPYIHGETGALAVILLAGASLRLVLSHRKEGALLPYILDVIWLWSSFVVVLGLVTNVLTEGSIIATVMGILLTSVLGGWLIKKTGRDEVIEVIGTGRLTVPAPGEERGD